MCEKIVLLSKRLISWAPDSRQAHVGFHQHKLGTRICTCCAHCARSGRFVALGVRHNSWVSFPCVFVQWSFMMLMHLLPTLSKSACLTASYCIAVKHWESKGYALKMHAPPGMEFHSISPIFWGNAVEHADIPPSASWSLDFVGIVGGPYSQPILYKLWWTYRYIPSSCRSSWRIDSGLSVIDDGLIFGKEKKTQWFLSVFSRKIGILGTSRYSLGLLVP